MLITYFTILKIQSRIITICTAIKQRFTVLSLAFLLSVLPRTAPQMPVIITNGRSFKLKTEASFTAMLISFAISVFGVAVISVTLTAVTAEHIVLTGAAKAVNFVRFFCKAFLLYGYGKRRIISNIAKPVFFLAVEIAMVQITVGFQHKIASAHPEAFASGCFLV